MHTVLSRLGIAVPLAVAASFAHNESPQITPTAVLSIARASHSASLLPDGRVLIAGGFGGSGYEQTPYATTELFDPATSRFVAGPSMRIGRTGHTATTLLDGTILIAGGWTGNPRVRGG